MTLIKKTAVILLLLLVAGMAIVPCVSASSTAEDVDSATAQKVAYTQLKVLTKESQDYEDWTYASLEEPKLLYGLDNDKTAYAFEVIVMGEKSGYIIVSAKRTNYPILEYSRGQLPIANPQTLERSEKVAHEKAPAIGSIVGSPRMLYLGGTFYFAKYPVYSSDDRSAEPIIVDLTDMKVIDPEFGQQNAVTKGDITKLDAIRFEEAEKDWAALEGTSVNMSSFAVQESVPAAGSQYIPGVPLYEWYLGCAPTAAGMVLAYRDSHGYSNFPDNQYTLISELATAMGTSGGSTCIWNVDDGMNTVAQNHGYSYSTLHMEEDSWLDYSEVQREVNAYKPFVLNMLGGGTAYGNSQPYGDHSVAVIGYESYSSGDYVVVQDTWTPLSARSLRFGSWSYALADYSR